MGWKLILSPAEHPRREAVKNAPYVQGWDLSPQQRLPPNEEKQQVFVAACNHDLKFLSLSDAERPPLRPLVVLGIAKWEL